MHFTIQSQQLLVNLVVKLVNRERENRRRSVPNEHRKHGRSIKHLFIKQTYLCKYRQACKGLGQVMRRLR